MSNQLKPQVHITWHDNYSSDLCDIYMIFIWFLYDIDMILIWYWYSYYLYDIYIMFIWYLYDIHMIFIWSVFYMCYTYPSARPALSASTLMAASSSSAFNWRSTWNICGTWFKMPRNIHIKLKIYAMWGPPVISWFISPSNYCYKYHKP